MLVYSLYDKSFYNKEHMYMLLCIVVYDTFRNFSGA